MSIRLRGGPATFRSSLDNGRLADHHPTLLIAHKTVFSNSVLRCKRHPLVKKSLCHFFRICARQKLRKTEKNYNEQFSDSGRILKKKFTFRVCLFVWLSKDSEASLQPSGLLMMNGRQTNHHPALLIAHGTVFSNTDPRCTHRPLVAVCESSFVLIAARALRLYCMYFSK